MTDNWTLPAAAASQPSAPTSEAASEAASAPSGLRIADHFPHLDSYSHDQLMLRREELLDTCLKDGVRDYKSMTDSSLEELFAVNRLLRRKNAGPPKKAKGAPKPGTSLDDLI